MGAAPFTAVGRGATPAAAFTAARNRAQWEYGADGYTGSLAEKTEFVVATPPFGVAPAEYHAALEASGEYWSARESRMVREPDPSWAASAPGWAEVVATYNDKWAPAVAIQTGPDEWLFCGWASC